jgi:TolB-like protein
MFTDIVGYTALMQANEDRAVILRRRSEKVLRAAIGTHSGELLQTYGDGTLSIFPSAVLAVQAAYQVQCELLNKPVVHIRIGIHLGDILHSEDGIFGDGVNVASRIESSGVPGSVLMSDKVADELSSHPTLTVTRLGAFEFKNVQESVVLYALNLPPLTVPAPQEVLAKIGGRPDESIAVLPFVNLSSDPDNEFFSDGITEELLNVLARIKDLRVTARTSSFAYKGRSIDVRTIAQELGVRHILEGSVRKAGDQVRITAQLIDAADGYHLWSDNFNGRLEDVFALQDEISRKIAEHLRVLFGMEDAEPIEQSDERKGIDPEAHDHFLRGRFLGNRWQEKESREAIHHF